MEIDKDLQEIIDLAADVTNTAIKQFSDGVQYTDAFAFIPVFQEIPAAVKDASKAWGYLADMTEEKENDMVDAVLLKLPDASEKVRTLVMRVIRAMAADYMLIKTAVGFSAAA